MLYNQTVPANLNQSVVQGLGTGSFSCGFRSSCFSLFFSCSFSPGFCFLHLQFHVVSQFHVFVNLFWCFQLFNYIFMLSNKSVFHLFFGFVFPVHYVLVSRHAVLCLFPVCVYSYTFKLFLLQSSASFSKTFWLRSKASIANEQDTCHEASHMKIRMKLRKNDNL